MAESLALKGRRSCNLPADQIVLGMNFLQKFKPAFLCLWCRGDRTAGHLPSTENHSEVTPGVSSVGNNPTHPKTFTALLLQGLPRSCPSQPFSASPQCCSPNDASALFSWVPSVSHTSVRITGKSAAWLLSPRKK